MKGFSKKYPNAKLIFLDAHLDCQDDMLPPSHEDVLRAVINEGFFKPDIFFFFSFPNKSHFFSSYI